MAVINAIEHLEMAQKLVELAMPGDLFVSKDSQKNFKYSTDSFGR